MEELYSTDELFNKFVDKIRLETIKGLMFSDTELYPAQSAIYIYKTCFNDDLQHRAKEKFNLDIN